MKKRPALPLASLTLALGFAACASDVPDAPLGPIDDDPPLGSADELLMGAPSNDTLPEEGKEDAVYPAQFDLVSTQSPVRSQQSRGVCSIFSTTALMEHLYIVEGTVAMPDFSEQYLQWSVKNEVGSFPSTSGSNAEYNLQALSQYGGIEERFWPYEGTEWGASNDPMCAMDPKPTRCYTNGEPPEMARMAQRFRLPRGRYISSRVRSIKGHMTSTSTAVIASGTFFYQAWNHRRSSLPTNQTYFANGYVLSPNEEDRSTSLMNRAGHSILLVGWDDDLEVQRRDAMGNPVVDASGNPVMEKGFFLFKNSWGTGSFGTLNRFGAGYGWISFAHVEEHLSATSSGLPEIMVPEVCDDMSDNDGNGASDCDDAACMRDPACMMMPVGGRYTSDARVMIPDNDPDGATSKITVADSGAVATLAVTIAIDHTYRGDLEVKLSHAGRETVLHDQTGGAEDDLRLMLPVSAFDGMSAGGEWTLSVVDHANEDIGALESWSLEMTFAP